MKVPHFSQYAITEKKIIDNGNVPDTYDGIDVFITLGMISLVGLCGTTLYFKKEY